MLRILLIDDNLDDRILAIRELKRALSPLHVEEIGDAISFSRVLEQQTFDLVITDYQLRWSTGLDVLRTLKAQFPDCPVIMFTDSGSEEVAVEGMKAGLSDYVLKGRRLYRLAVAVQESLSKVELHHQYQAAVEQLRLSETRYRHVSELTSDFAYAYRIEPNGTPVREWVTEAFTRITGYSFEEIDPQGGWQSLIHPDDWAIALERHEQLMSGQSDVREFRIITKSGDIRWVQNYGHPIWDEAEQRVTAIYGAVQDISDRKQAEAEHEQLLIREHTARLSAEAAEQRFRFLAEATRLITASLDYPTTLTRIAQLLIPKLADWCFIDVNQENLKSFGEPIIAATDPAKEALVRELRQRYPAAKDINYGPAKAMRTGEPELVSHIPESLPEAIAEDAEHLRLLQQLSAKTYMVVPLKIGDRILGTLSCASSQPDRYYNQADLEMVMELAQRAAIAIDNARLYQEVWEANRVKDEFLAIVSHELRTPLNAMLGWAQMLRYRTFDTATTTKALETIERNAKLQAKLIDDILDISRIVRGQIQLHLCPVNFVSIVETVINDIQLSAEAKSIQLTAKLNATKGVVLGDPERLQQIVWNLLSNAIKFTPPGGQVVARLKQDDSQVYFIVEDTGQGISRTFLPYVFDRFRQEDAKITRLHGGLGLGLAIVRHLAEMHNGTVHATSAGEGLGATFTVILPLKDCTQRSPLPESSPLAKAYPILPLHGLRVLVVDDDADTLDLVRITLEQYQVQVTAAQSAQEALQLVSHCPPDLLISDIGMPNEDGYTLIRKIRNLEPFGQSIPAVALTAFAREEERERALACGFQMHIPKPIEPTELINLIAKLVAQTHRPANEYFEQPLHP